MRRIAIFGGSFNPIHKGHLAIAQAMIDQKLCDELWLLVTPQNPFKRDDQLIDDQLRLLMAMEAVAKMPGIKVSDYEFSLPRPSYTYQTLRKLKADYPDCTFSLLIGADNMLSFNRWSHPEEILANHEIYVYPRQGYDLDRATLPSGVHLLDVPLYDISSTEIRERVAVGNDISDMVSPNVAKILIQKRD